MSYYGYYSDAAHGGAEAFTDPYSVTIAFWYYDTGFIEIDAGTADALYCSATTDFVNAHSNDDFDPGHSAVVSSLGLSATRWNHAAGVWSASNARKAYSNGGTALGGAEATDTANTSLSLLTSRIRVGQSTRKTTADVAIWNTTLTATEVAFLANGGRPHQLSSRLSNLVFYQPNRRASVTYPSGSPSVSTIDEMTGRVPTITDVIAEGTFQPIYFELPVATPHRE